MKNPKFDFQDTCQPSYFFESFERVFYTLSAIVGGAVIAFKLGEFLGCLSY